MALTASWPSATADVSLLPYPITTDHEVARIVDLVLDRPGAASSRVM